MESTEKSGVKVSVSPWVLSHLESHLVFGPFFRHPAIPIGYAFIALGLIVLILYWLTSTGTPTRVGGGLDKLLFVVPWLFLVKRRSPLEQLSFAWWTTKITGWIVCPLLILLGPIVYLARGDADGVATFLLGCIWLPSIEFIPKVTPHQKWLTLARLILTGGVISSEMLTGMTP